MVTEIKNEVPGTTGLIKKTDCKIKIAKIENKIPIFFKPDFNLMQYGLMFAN